MRLRDKYGWPVETIKGRPLINVIRRILHTNIWQTLTWKPKASSPTIQADMNAGSR